MDGERRAILRLGLEKDSSREFLMIYSRHAIYTGTILHTAFITSSSRLSHFSLSLASTFLSSSRHHHISPPASRTNHPPRPLDSYSSPISTPANRPYLPHSRHSPFHYCCSSTFSCSLCSSTGPPALFPSHVLLQILLILWIPFQILAENITVDKLREPVRIDSISEHICHSNTFVMSPSNFT